MQSPGFRIFSFGSFLMMFIPFSTGATAFDNRPYYFSAPHQSPVEHYRVAAPTPPPARYARDWRHQLPGRTADYYPPQDAYQGYRFRPTARVTRYDQVPGNRYAKQQYADYRWRPHVRQPIRRQWQGNAWTLSTYRRDSRRDWNSYLSSQTRPVYRGVISPPPSYAGRYRFRPQALDKSRYPAKHVYRPANVSIAQHYVYRPLRPRSQQQQSSRLADQNGFRSARLSRPQQTAPWSNRAYRADTGHLTYAAHPRASQQASRHPLRSTAEPRFAVPAAPQWRPLTRRSYAQQTPAMGRTPSGAVTMHPPSYPRLPDLSLIHI